MPRRSACAAVAVAGTLALAGCSADGGAQGVAPRAAVTPAAAAPAAPPDRPSATSSPAPSSPAPTPVVEQGDGRLHVVDGGTAGSGSGEPTAYVVEVEGGLGVDPAAFAREVDRVLADPRSWGAGGRRALHRVDAGQADFRVALTSPRTTDRLCAPLRTNGVFSCASGGRAVLNAARWLDGAASYEGALTAYREYLVNHEVGHVLGHGHVSCPGAGQPAPVMLQQTKGLAGCVRNGWPYP